MVTLDVGCGKRKHKGSIGIDLRRVEAVDIIADATALPFRDDCFDKIYLSHIIEHIPNMIEFMREIWRVCKDKATIHIWTPHFTSPNSYTDPTHVRHLTSRSLDYFDNTTTMGKELWFDLKIRFKIKIKKLFFSKRKSRLWNFFIEKLANKNLARYEAILGWIFPGETLYFELEALKE
jgi:predicted SAM-dependent methyltransferase